jgi:pyruvate, orthophosphate dikinase
LAQYVYFFGGGKADGNRDMKEILGGKGSGLAEMTNAGLPVPPGFTVSTAACNLFVERGGTLPTEIDAEIEKNLLGSSRSWGRSSVTRGTRCSSPSAAGRSSPCPG